MTLQERSATKRIEAAGTPSKNIFKNEPSRGLNVTPLRNYFTRKSSKQVRTNDLPFEDGAVGAVSLWGFIYCCISLTVPLAYIYILLILLRELCMYFPQSIYAGIKSYLPWLATVVATMAQSSLLVEIWCVVEAIFFVGLKLQIRYLQRKDPLEASLSSAPMMELVDRQILWGRMMASESKDPVEFISGWFFDEPLEKISKYDVRDFVAWSMFEGRNQEHLTGEELQQVDEFVEDFEYRLSVHLHGLLKEDGMDEKENINANPELNLSRSTQNDIDWKELAVMNRPLPKEIFRFHESTTDEQPNFFSNLYENYKQHYEQYRSMLENADFHPVQDFRNFMAEAEENALATASQMYENAYHSLITPGSSMDKQLAALSHATQVQLTEAWNSVKGMRKRLETAEFLSTQRKRLRQQLKGYRVLLNRMRSMSSSVPSKQMANLMRKITDCNDAMQNIENRAMDAFAEATGYARKSLMPTQEPQHYAKYSSDPLLGVVTYPLGLHLFILGATEIPLRILMHRRSFTRLVVGKVAYYFNPGQQHDDDNDEEKIPIVFVHGIGIGLIAYIPLIDQMLQSGRPMLLPEIPYVSGFRPFQSPNSVLSPAVVSSTMTDMLATHGYLRGTFVGHSYGSVWLSYMLKYAPNAIGAVIFLDPICFCLHVPRLTKQFVYHRPDPGTASFMVRTDVIINWTIQRSFPWSWIVLFHEQIHVPCSIFLSERDMLVPATKVEAYFQSKGAPIKDFSDVTRNHFEDCATNVTVFRGDGHGGWCERPFSTSPVIAECVEVLCRRAEQGS